MAHDHHHACEADDVVGYAEVWRGQAYQQRLLETRTQFNNVVNKLRLVEQKFQQVDEWLKTMEEKVSLRTARQSSRAAKEMQLHQMKVLLV